MYILIENLMMTQTHMIILLQWKARIVSIHSLIEHI